MRRGFTILKIRGIPVRVDPTWFITLAVLAFILYNSISNPVWNVPQTIFIAVGLVLMLFLLVLIHELAHSIVAQMHGARVNDITLFLLGGVSNITSEIRHARAEFLITIVGPLTNVVLFGVFLAFELSPLTDNLSALGVNPNAPNIADVSIFDTFIRYGVIINATLAVFNMLPGLPLDGGRVLSSIVWAFTRKPEKPYLATAVAATAGQILGGLLIAIAIISFLASIVFVPLLDSISAEFIRRVVIFTANLLGTFGAIWFAFLGAFLITAAVAEKRHAKIKEQQQQQWNDRL